MSVRDEYKMTELGEIPVEWELKPLSQVAKVKGGKRLPKGEQLVDEPTQHPYLRVTDMELGGINATELKYVPDHIWPLIKQYTISKDDLYISVAGTLGVVGSIPVELDGANLTENADKICDIGCSRDYLKYQLQSNLIKTIIDTASTVCAQPKLAIEQINNFPILLPPLPEQQKIVDILSTVDEHISETESLIEKTRVLKQGMMQQLLNKGIGHAEFKDTEIGRIPVEWEVRNCNQVFYTITDYVANGSFASIKENVKYLQNEDYAILVRLTDYNSKFSGPFVYVSKSSYDFLKKTSLFVDDIIIANVGAVGSVFKVPALDKPLTLGPNAILVRTREDRDYIFNVLLSNAVQDSLKNITTTTAQPKFNKTDFKEILLPIPPNSEQNHIAAILTSIDDQIDSYQTKLTSLTKLKSALMQQLLTGKTRVKI